MTKKSLTGKDTIIIGQNGNGQPFNDFGDGDVVNLTFPNELMSVKTGKGGNSIYAFNESGKQVDVELRVLLGSDDDKYLNSLLTNMKQDPASFVLMNGEFIKRVGDGEGNVNNVKYTMSGGIFSQEVDVKENVEGDTEQAIAIYRMKFTNAPRSIGG